MGASLGAPTLCHRDRREAGAAVVVCVREGGFNLPDINFSSCFPSFRPSLGSSNHKSLLGAITAAALQWAGGRIDSRVEDESREGASEEGRGAVKRLPRLMLTENILIAK